VTDPSVSGHSQRMAVVPVKAEGRSQPAQSEPSPSELSFETVYEEGFPFVWRSLRYLGVSPASLDDAAQDVFVVVHKKLEGFDGQASIKSWLFAIAHLVALGYRRRERRKGGHLPLPGGLPSSAPGPDERLKTAEAFRLVESFLDTLDDAKRAVFVLAELEQMSAPEISRALEINLNTVYSRLRAARSAFQKAVSEHGRGES
jgi:RNA polymerase sigma-70 factor (ECF subfamily)